MSGHSFNYIALWKEENVQVRPQTPLVRFAKIYSDGSEKHVSYAAYSYGNSIEEAQCSDLSRGDRAEFPTLIGVFSCDEIKSFGVCVAYSRSGALAAASPT